MTFVAHFQEKASAQICADGQNVESNAKVAKQGTGIAVLF
jgi:hypothetical protein